MKKLPSIVTNSRLGWVVVGTANQPKSQILYQKNVSLHDLYLMTLRTKADDEERYPTKMQPFSSLVEGSFLEIF